MKPAHWLAIIAVAMSAAPWLYGAVAFPLATTGDQLAGAFYIVAFIGLLSFSLTAPIAAIAARFWWQYGLIAMPTLLFQVVSVPVSFMGLFIPGSLNMADWIEMPAAAILGVAWYVMLYWISRKIAPQGALARASTAGGLAFATFMVIVVRFLLAH
jgi:hypothetical protein